MSEFYTSGMPWVLMKGGYFYAHNSCGYVSRVLLAEIYDEDYAKRYASHSDEVEAYPLTEFLKSVDEIAPYTRRIKLMMNALAYRTAEQISIANLT